MASAAGAIVERWTDGSVVDLDAESRKLTLRALGQSVLGLNLDEHVDTIADPLRTVVEYVTKRGVRAVNPPRWLPTPAQRRARAARDKLTGSPTTSCSSAAPTRPAMLRWSMR